MVGDLEKREDVRELVSNFYSKVRKNKEIGEFFNRTVLDWDEHEERLTDFWENTLFMNKTYSGNPIRVHLNVDRLFDHTIEQKHFGIWLNLWFETIDELFQGNNATKAKMRARKMATLLFIKIFENRN